MAAPSLKEQMTQLEISMSVSNSQNSGVTGTTAFAVEETRKKTNNGLVVEGQEDKLIPR